MRQGLAMTWAGEPFEPIGALAVSDLAENALAVLPRKPTIEQIRQFEAVLMSLPQVECGNVHHFAPGIYMREGRIPAGTVVTGRMHRTEHLCLLAAGVITVWTDDGMQRLTAPAVVKSLPGAKRVGYAHTDVTWITVHATDETDPDKLVDELTFPEPTNFKGQTSSLLDRSAP